MSFTLPFKFALEYKKTINNTIIIIPVIIPPRENVITPLYAIVIAIIILKNKLSFVFDSKIILEKKINIPSPKTVATWLGPKPPDVSKLDCVLVTTS